MEVLDRENSLKYVFALFRGQYALEITKSDYGARS